MTTIKYLLKESELIRSLWKYEFSIFSFSDKTRRTTALSLRLVAVNINSKQYHTFTFHRQIVSAFCATQCTMPSQTGSKLCRICMSVVTLSHLNAEPFSASFEPQARRCTVKRNEQIYAHKKWKSVDILWQCLVQNKWAKKRAADSVGRVVKATLCILPVELLLSCEIWLLENVACITNRIQQLPHYKPNFSLSTFTLCVQEFVLEIFGHCQTSRTNNCVCMKMCDLVKFHVSVNEIASAQNTMNLLSGLTTQQHRKIITSNRNLLIREIFECFGFETNAICLEIVVCFH